MAHIYGNGSNSTVGGQIVDFHYYKQALVDIHKDQFFGQLADTMSMPKHMGKTIRRYHYIPMLDDRNVNDQGIDAFAALSANDKYTINARMVKTSEAAAFGASKAKTIRSFSGNAFNIKANTDVTIDGQAFSVPGYAAKDDGAGVAQTGASNLKALANLFENIYGWAVNQGIAPAGNSTTALFNTSSGSEVVGSAIIAALTAITGLGYSIYCVGTDGSHTLIATDDFESASEIIAKTTALNTAKCFQSVTGNLYGSSKDPGYIASKIPPITEGGGRVNRVGYKRLELEGTFQNFGLFTEYTQDALDFDTDRELLGHITSEITKTANEVYEAKLQIDLLNSAGILRFAGDAISKATIGVNDIVSYADLVTLAIELDNNRCSKDTKIITGSRMIDTKTISAARYIYIGSELIPTLRKMKDYHNQAAFVDVKQYANAGEVAKGEIGSIDQFRFIVVPEMMSYPGYGAAVDGTAGNNIVRHTGNSVDVFPMLVVGSQSFTTIGFQTDGQSAKFKVIHRKPAENADLSNPYGKKGFYSIQWWYGFMCQRPEHIAVLYTAAEI